MPPNNVLKRIPPKVLWTLGGLVGTALAVFLAWQMGAHEVRTELREVRGHLHQAEGRLNALEARRLIHQTILQLEARNFGSAQDKVARAGEFLAAAAKAAPDAGTYEAPLAQLQAFQTQVDPNVGEQITTLVRIAHELDEQLPTPAAPHGAP
jgi:hypothetical protein